MMTVVSSSIALTEFFFLGISSILPIADGLYCIHFHSLPTLGWMKGSVSRVATLENLDILVNQEIGERM